MLTLRVTRIAPPFFVDSPWMAAILLDIDGVFHVSGLPIAGAADAVGRLRRAGHRLRFVTNTTVRTRSALAAELLDQGIVLDEGELQTTAAAAVHALGGRRVLALTMPAVVPDLEGLDLVGEEADVVLVGGVDEEGAGRVFSYMNLARAFGELQAGAELYCLHKNRWWQTQRGPILDSGAFVAGLEYAAGVEAVVLGKPSPHYFAAALEALDAEPTLTWMVGDDIESDIAGAKHFGLRTALVRTGKFRPDDLERSGVVPDIVINSLAEFPEWLERAL
jgi:HAD superfamily hydrolase (TIGR01458 family)